MESVGDYEYNTKDLIGHGAFAVVFKGRQKKNHGFVVAIKSITKKNLSKSQNLLGKEIKILKELTELHHENVVALLDCKETSHYVYLVMEYCNGGDLADYLHAKGTLSEETIRLFLRQLAGAMRALNAKGIIHRDLKPQNILLCHSGKTNCAPHEIRLKIADFGFARFLQEGVMAATLCGSPMYMAPEVIMSLQYDAKADLWSIGTIVFQCLTGKAPFQAQTPQALKAFYEKNVNLAPKILPGTSSELSDLLVKLLKRNAKDRLEFDEFFDHPFLKLVLKPTSPVPVPARQRSHSHEMSPMRTLTDLPLSRAQPPPLSPTDVCEDLPGEAMASAPLGSLPYDAGGFKGTSGPSSIEEQDDFVLVPNNLQTENMADSFHCMNHKRKSSDTYCSSPLTIGTPPSKVSTLVGSPSSGVMAYHHRRHSSSPSSPRPSYLPVASSPNSGSANAISNEPIPVPGQQAAYEQIQQSLGQSPGSASPVVGEPPDIQRSLSNLSSPSRSPKQWDNKTTNVPHSQPIGLRTNSMESMDRTTPDISSLSPPSVQFVIGSPPYGISRKTSVGGFSNMGTPPQPSVWSCSPQHFNSGRHTPTNSPIRKSSLNSPPVNSNYFFTSGPLPPILGSPANQSASFINCNNMFPNLARPPEGTGGTTSPSKPLVVPFATRAHTLPDFSPKDVTFTGSAMDIGHQESAFLPRSCSTGKLNDAFNNIRVTFGVSQKGYCNSESPPPNSVMPYGGHGGSTILFGPDASCGQYRMPFSGGMLCDSPTGSGNHQFHYGTSPPNMEGPVFFVAPELPQETLLEKEHNDTLAKLNFVLTLVDCIVDLAKARSTPIAALTDSMGGQQEQAPVFTESSRRAEQLVLYIRALQMLASSLNLSREELKDGRLQPSNSVKNVVSNMNEKYHYCLQMCKSLNSQNLLQVIRSDPRTSSITADKLLYNYAIQMCQSAALDELFGNPEECFRRYQTAQILLHSLAQQINNDDDRNQLCKQKQAVEKRLYVLQQQGYIYSYNTFCTT